MNNNFNTEPIVTTYIALSEHYIAILESFSEQQMNSRPSADGWTPSQVIQHIIKANNSRFLLAPGQKPNRPVDQKIPELESLFLNFDIKMTSPDFLLPERKPVSKQECIDAIQKTFAALAAQLPTAQLDQVLETPLGALTKWELANFIIYHSKRHLHQLEKLKTSMAMNKKDIAEAFSKGEFEKVYAQLADTIIWNVVEENEFAGKATVMQQCEQVASYFRSVVTDFKTQQVICEGQHVAVSGTAEFFRNNQRISFISACDVYEFNAENQVKNITSYCIQKKL